MAVLGRTVSVTTTATRLDTLVETDDASGSAVAVFNNGSAVVYLGGPTVTTAGYPLAVGAHLSVEVCIGEALYGTVASGTVEVRVLESGV